MNYNDINAKTISTERKIEKEDLILTINFGLFFYEKKHTSKGLELSKYYKTEIPEKTNEKFYSLNISYSNYDDGLENVLSHILWILEGYTQYKKKVDISFDIFGIDKGFIEGFLFCNLFDSTAILNLDKFVNIHNDTIVELSKEIVNLSKCVILHSFTFTSISNTSIQNNEEQNIITEPQNHNIDNNRNGNYITGNVIYNEYLGESIKYDGPVIEAYRGNIFTELYSKYIVLNLNTRDWIEEKLKIIDNTSLVLLLVPEPTLLTKISATGLEILSILGNLACASISFELGILMFRGEKARKEEFKTGRKHLLGAIPFSTKYKTICKVFGKGFRFKIDNNNVKIEDLKNACKEAQKLVKGKKAKEAEGRYYHQETRKIKKQNAKLENIESTFNNIEKDDSIQNSVEFLNNLCINMNDAQQKN